MPDTEDTDGEKREKPSGTTLTVEKWIELMDKHDPLDQYAKERKRERREKRREERKEEQAENGGE
jgi:dihydrodipicolinate reductase